MRESADCEILWLIFICMVAYIFKIQLHICIYGCLRLKYNYKFVCMIAYNMELRGFQPETVFFIFEILIFR